MQKAKQRLFLTAERDRLVAEDDPAAATLYAAEGDEIPDSAVALFGLVDGALPGVEAEAARIAAEMQRLAEEADARAAAEALAKAHREAGEQAEAAAAEQAAAEQAAAEEAAAAAAKELAEGENKEQAEGENKAAEPAAPAAPSQPAAPAKPKRKAR